MVICLLGLLVLTYSSSNYTLGSLALNSLLELTPRFLILSNISFSFCFFEFRLALLIEGCAITDTSISSSLSVSFIGVLDIVFISLVSISISSLSSCMILLELEILSFTLFSFCFLLSLEYGFSKTCFPFLLTAVATISSLV